MFIGATLTVILATLINGVQATQVKSLRGSLKPTVNYSDPVFTTKPVATPLVYSTSPPKPTATLDPIIKVALRGTPMTTKQILKVVKEVHQVPEVTKHDLNSRLYTMLGKQLVKREVTSKAPVWSI